MSFNGVIVPTWLVIQESVAPCLWLNNDSGGGPWLAISESLFWPAKSVLGVRLPIDLQRGYFSRCQSLRDPGPISR